MSGGACITPAADQALHDEALAMAWTAIDRACDATMRQRLMPGGGHLSRRDRLAAQQHEPDKAEQ
jgi:hypothetical protein